MDDINAIKIYIQNTYPNVAIVENNDCLLITNNLTKSKSYKKLSKKLENKLTAKMVNTYLTEFKLESRMIFTDMYKFNKFEEFKNLWVQFLKHHPYCEKSSEIVVSKWIWTHDNKKEILIDIESYDGNNPYGVIFKDNEVMYITEDDNIFIQDTIDKNLIERTKTFKHIKFFECDGNGDDYYNKEKHTHQHCFGIMDYRDSNTEHYEEEPDPKTLKIASYNNYIQEEVPEEGQLRVIPYDIINNIYKEITYGFLVKEIDDAIYCHKKLSNGQEIELSDADKVTCSALGITYQSLEAEEQQLRVVPYDTINNIHKEIIYGFLVKEIGDDVCCYKKLVNNEEIELSCSDRTICSALGITYRRF